MKKRGQFAVPNGRTSDTLYRCPCSPEGCATDVREEVIIGEEENSFLEEEHEKESERPSDRPRA